MLRKGTFCYFWLANTANQHSDPHDDVIKLIKATIARKRTGSKPMEHCTADDLERNLLRRKDEKCTFHGMKRKRI